METLTMSAKEVPRAGLLKAVLAGRITNAQGPTALRMSVRQFQRVKTRFREHGARSLLHQLRGRPGNRHLAPETRAQITTLMTSNRWDHQALVPGRPRTDLLRVRFGVTVGQEESGFPPPATHFSVRRHERRIHWASRMRCISSPRVGSGRCRKGSVLRR